MALKKFEDYLRTIHSQLDETSSNGHMASEAYERWIENLDVAEMGEYADRWGKLLQGVSNCCNAPMVNGGIQCEACGSDGT